MTKDEIMKSFNIIPLPNIDSICISYDFLSNVMLHIGDVKTYVFTNMSFMLFGEGSSSIYLNFENIKEISFDSDIGMLTITVRGAYNMIKKVKLPDKWCNFDKNI